MASLIAVHTGAGNTLNETKYQKVIKKACLEGKKILRNGGTALDACESAIVVLENCFYTNAGYGSNLTWDRQIECDASIMDSHNMQFGACAGVGNVQNPITLARKICDKQSDNMLMGRIPPMVMCGEGALQYAREVGVKIVDTEALISKKAYKCWNYYKDQLEKARNADMLSISPLDTVGAVCIDTYGNCCAGCSSGGLILKVPGRVGQAGTYGAGCFAIKSDTKCVATCTTGNGEYLIKTLLAKEIVNDQLQSDESIRTLHDTFKKKFLQSPLLPGLKKLFGGALTVTYNSNSGDGELLWSHSTKAICLGYMTTEQKSPKFVYSALNSTTEPGTSVSVSGTYFKLR